MTYFLEKNFDLDDNGKMIPHEYTHALVRPCKWDYDKVLKWMRGELKEALTLEGAVAWFNPNANYKINKIDPLNDCKTFEEWMIKLDLEKGLTLDFEQICILANDVMRSSFTAKAIDLHTDEILYDNMKKTIEKVMHLNNSKI